MKEEPKYTTEQRNPASMNLDQLPTLEALRIFNEEDRKVPEVISGLLPEIAQAIDSVVDSFEQGGRLIYIGAGTSGRLGVLDASEAPPTFGVSPDMVVGVIAGGEEAIRNPIEGAEDDGLQGQRDLETINLSSKDTVIGIAASGRTPYVIGALEYAQSIGAHTVAIANNQDSKIGKVADIAIEAEVGPEILTGSTRLKSGTAQKLIINMISTMAMVRIGKVYQNLMVDVQTSNEKLRHRAVTIVMDATGVSEALAVAKLKESDGDVKKAIVMILLNQDLEFATKSLSDAHGKIHNLINK